MVQSRSPLPLEFLVQQPRLVGCTVVRTLTVQAVVGKAKLVLAEPRALRVGRQGSQGQSKTYIYASKELVLLVELPAVRGFVTTAGP